MKLTIITHNLRKTNWWANFTRDVRDKVEMKKPGTFRHEYNKLLEIELKKYGGTFNYMSVEFEDDFKATWFILRWS